MIKKYKAVYSAAAAFLIVIVPLGCYAVFSRYQILRTWPLFPSVSWWSLYAVLAWLGSLFFMMMAVHWNSRIDQAFQERGFTGIQRAKIIWNMALMPAVIGCLFALYTLLELPPLGQEFNGIRLLVLSVGFVPLTVYGLARANQIAANVVNAEPLPVPEAETDYLKAKWWPIVVLVLTYVLTPFFGSGIAAAQLWRLLPRYRHILYAATVLSGLLVTSAIAPVAALLKGAKYGDPMAYHAFALYSAAALFSGFGYILLIKGALYSRRLRN